MIESKQVQLDGDRNYGSPPPWQLREEGPLLYLCPRPRPPLRAILAIGGLHAMLALAVLLLVRRVDIAVGIAFLGAAAVATAYACYSFIFKSDPRPWLRVDRAMRRVDLSRTGEQIGFDDVVELQKVVGFNRLPDRDMTRIAELNLMYRGSDGQVHKYPLIAAYPGGLDADSVDGCAQRLASAIGTAVRNYNAP